MGLDHLTVKENKELLKKEKGRVKKKKKKMASRNTTEVMGPQCSTWNTHSIGFPH